MVILVPPAGHAQNIDDDAMEANDDAVIFAGAFSDYSMMKAATPQVEKARSVLIRAETRFRVKGVFDRGNPSCNRRNADFIFQ